jgi:hypothetical protein
MMMMRVCLCLCLVSVLWRSLLVLVLMLVLAQLRPACAAHRGRGVARQVRQQPAADHGAAQDAHGLSRLHGVHQPGVCVMCAHGVFCVSVLALFPCLGVSLWVVGRCSALLHFPAFLACVVRANAVACSCSRSPALLFPALSVCQSVCLFAWQSVCLAGWLAGSLAGWLSVWLSVCLTVCLSFLCSACAQVAWRNHVFLEVTQVRYMDEAKTVPGPAMAAGLRVGTSALQSMAIPTDLSTCLRTYIYCMELGVLLLPRMCCVCVQLVLVMGFDVRCACVCACFLRAPLPTSGDIIVTILDDETVESLDDFKEVRACAKETTRDHKR